mmetsp:Transcript_123893/g.264087  ORF Transcript_123893/g.264087 Transcript_123893/m.264087 type:complete len:688 (+) Transcript_123893:61-2124(+)
MRISLTLGLLSAAVAQQRSEQHVETPPPVAVAHCTKAGGCKLEHMNLTLDGNWRWAHGMNCQGVGAARQCYSSGNCYTSGSWDKKACDDPDDCAQNCALEGVTGQEYKNTYGVVPVAGGVELKFVSMGAGGQNVGSRLYLMDTEETYKLFKLKNREFTFDVDVSGLPCGLNGAVYFSEMQVDGGKGGSNTAGAKYGTGYCDAQCPHDIKFMNGKANIKKWNITDTTGSLGSCCTEMDIWEANKASTAYTPHPCLNEGLEVCEGLKCGDTAKGERYQGLCDKDGCDFNSYRLGEHTFLGEGAGFTINTEKPITIVTQWITSDGTDYGDLTEIRRLYVQDGKVIQNSDASRVEGGGNSITDEFCAAQKKAFGDPNDFAKKGGLRSVGKTLDRGMVLVLSLWDDHISRMLWLDSNTGNKTTKDLFGSLRGPCPTDSGAPSELRSKYPSASVSYTNIMYGEIDSTYTAGDAAKPSSAEKADATFEAKLRAFSAPPTQAPPPPQPQQPVQQQPMQPQQVVQQPAQQPAQQPVQQQVQPVLTPQQVAQSQQGAASPASSSGGCGAAFDQCGGQQFTGGTCCQQGCTCEARGGFYSQCVPPEGMYMCNNQALTSVVMKQQSSDSAPLRGALGSSASDDSESGSTSRWAGGAAVWAAVPAALAAAALVAVGRTRARRASPGAAPAGGDDQPLIGC